MSNLDIGTDTTPTSDHTADLAAPFDNKSIVKVWEKAALASEQVRLLCDLRDVGVGTNSIESFMRKLEDEDIVSWGNLKGRKWDKQKIDHELFLFLLNIKIGGAERKCRKWGRERGKEKRKLEK